MSKLTNDSEKVVFIITALILSFLTSFCLFDLITFCLSFTFHLPIIPSFMSNFSDVYWTSGRVLSRQTLYPLLCWVLLCCALLCSALSYSIRLHSSLFYPPPLYSDFLCCLNSALFWVTLVPDTLGNNLKFWKGKSSLLKILRHTKSLSWHFRKKKISLSRKFCSRTVEIKACSWQALSSYIKRTRESINSQQRKA